MVICLPVWLHFMVLFLVLQYMHGILTKQNGANIPNNKWVMGLLSTLGVSEFEPKCADPVSDEKNE